MKDLPNILKELKKLEDLRGDVPTYVYFGSIGGVNLFKTRNSLMKIANGQEIDIVLQSGGGSADDAYRLIRTFRKKYNVVNVIVPFWAKSAATLFAFGATRLVLHEFGELGPIDVQIKKDTETDPEGEWSSALNVQASLLQIEARSRQGMLEMFTQLRSKTKENNEILKIGRRQLAEMLLDYSAKFYQPLLQKVETIELGIMTRSLDVGKMYAKRILKQYTDTEDEKINKLIEFLVYDCPDHGYIVDYNVLQSYLSYVIKADEEPFGVDYNKELEKLSIHLMMADGDDNDVVGFLEDLSPKTNSVIIKDKNEQQNEQPNKAKGQSGNSGRSGNRPNQSNGERNAPKSDNIS